MTRRIRFNAFDMNCARRLSTLDHLTNGRIGWNVVTGYLPSAARNFGADDQLDHDERYNQADEYLEVLYKLSNAIQSAVAAFQEFDDDGREWTVRDIGRWAGIGGMGPVFVGSGATVADQLQDWVAETDLDGFNLAYAITPGSFEDIVRHVVPVLSERGAYATEYVPGTLRNKLLDQGDRLPHEHRGARYRLDGPASTALPDTVSRSGSAVGA